VFRADDVVLNPGDFCFAEAGTRIRTLLGSCVSITMWHPRLLIGGMCHYVVPHRRHHVPPGELSGRYADEAVELFRRQIARYKTRPEDYEVKMFGGGDQFPESRRGQGVLNIPQENVNRGLELLEQNGFRLIANHLGGTGPRNLVFDVTTGEVWMKHSGRPPIARSA
jgi:chemotaxis protein CheD